jgi:methylated-DNA-[protein]-cysteine S-methyltransferase
MKKTPIYWTLLNFEEWEIHLAATVKGLIYVGAANASLEELENWVAKHVPDSILVEDENQLKNYKLEFLQYLRGERRLFSVPTDYKGTPFQETVWQALCDIPYGHTRTYSDIAEQLNKPKSARAVGAAIGKNPVLITIPCHRVIGKNGTLTGYRGGLEMKTKLLELEKRLASNE